MIEKNFEEGDFAFIAADSNLDHLSQNDDFYLKRILKTIELDSKVVNVNEIKNLAQLILTIFDYKNDLFTIDNVYYSHHGKYEVTHADSIDYCGIRIPVEQVITDPDEWNVNICLDQIWELKMKTKGT